MKLNDNQLNFLLRFFDIKEYVGWKNIAIKLINNGYCIVAGTECIWKGGIGNFIKTSEASNAVDCLYYEFDLDYFMTSAYYKEVLSNYIIELNGKKSESEILCSDIQHLKSTTTLIFEQRAFVDGGWTDKGSLVTYVEGESEQEVRNRLDLNHGFVGFKEVTREEYNKKKKEAYQNYIKTYSI